MFLQEILSHATSAGRYLERYVNDGSPSGFTEVHTTSPETSPFGFRPHFRLAVAMGSNVREFGDFGRAHALDFLKDPRQLPIHPDMTRYLKGLLEPDEKSEDVRPLVVPTSSGRTVQVIAPHTPADHIKLHYAGVLGRITRELTWSKAIAGPETSALVEGAMSSNSLPKWLHILPEPYARTVQLERTSGASEEWGIVYRESRPVGTNASAFALTVPCFSLFSTDRLAVHHEPLLAQILREKDKSAESFFTDVLLARTLDSYFALLKTCGLQAEWNSQNLLYSFDTALSEVAVVMRDLESVDKDISLMEDLGLVANFQSAPYKCIRRDQYNYQIKHSFMFDFKLGECVLRPLCIVASQSTGVPFERLAQSVRSMVRKHLEGLPRDFLPIDTWYSFAKQLVDQSKDERPYVRHVGTPFR